jgi:hypothetical protein
MNTENTITHSAVQLHDRLRDLLQGYGSERSLRDLLIMRTEAPAWAELDEAGRVEHLLTAAAIDMLDEALTDDVGQSLAELAGDEYRLVWTGYWLDWAREQAQDTGMVDGDSPMAMYIDWGAWADDLAVDAYLVEVPGRYGQPDRYYLTL